MLRFSFIIGLVLILTGCATQHNISLAEEITKPNLSEIQAKIELQECKFNYAQLVQEKAQAEFKALSAQKNALEQKEEDKK